MMRGAVKVSSVIGSDSLGTSSTLGAASSSLAVAVSEVDLSVDALVESSASVCAAAAAGAVSVVDSSLSPAQAARNRTAAVRNISRETCLRMETSFTLGQCTVNYETLGL